MNSAIEIFDLNTYNKGSKNYFGVFTILGFDQRNLTLFRNLVLNQIRKLNFQNHQYSNIERNISGEDKLPVKLFEFITNNQMYLIIECTLIGDWEKVLDATLGIPDADVIFLVENLFKSNSKNYQHISSKSLNSIGEKIIKLYQKSQIFFISLHTANITTITLPKSIQTSYLPSDNKNNDENLISYFKNYINDLFKKITIPSIKIKETQSNEKRLNANFPSTVNSLMEYWMQKLNHRKGVLKKLITFIPNANNLKNKFDKNYEKIKSLIYPKKPSGLYYICKIHCDQKDCFIANLNDEGSFEEFKKYLNGVSNKCNNCGCNEENHLVIAEKLIRDEKTDKSIIEEESKKDVEEEKKDEKTNKSITEETSKKGIEEEKKDDKTDNSIPEETLKKSIEEEKKDTKNSQSISENKEMQVLQKNEEEKNEEEKKIFNEASNPKANNNNEKVTEIKKNPFNWEKSKAPSRSPLKSSSSTSQVLKQTQPKKEINNSSAKPLNNQSISKDKEIPVPKKNEEEKKAFNETSNPKTNNHNEKLTEKSKNQFNLNKNTTSSRSPLKNSYSASQTLKQTQLKKENNISPTKPIDNHTINKPQSTSSSNLSKESLPQTLKSNTTPNLLDNQKPNTLKTNFLNEYLYSSDHDKHINLSDHIFIFIGDKSSGKTSMILSFINTLTRRNFTNPIEIKPNVQSQHDSSVLYFFTCPNQKKYALIELKNDFDKDFLLSESARISELNKYCSYGSSNKITIVLIQKACENIKKKWKNLMKVFKSFETICIFTYFNSFDIEKNNIYKYFTMWEFIDNDTSFYERKDLARNELKNIDEKIMKIIDGLKENRENCKNILEKLLLYGNGGEDFMLEMPLVQILRKLMMESS
ncbi:hypothetical protein SteCoe_31014 [Stentor coeruleus]|uniref:Uncharacterized protein n=1 Tax=Stentor coeruleus TaxID=5963 RepID=A0A1R2B290_9CILI|nr:hypothetical protein SteCoe_31014 [Stentor coeruleus]